MGELEDKFRKELDKVIQAAWVKLGKVIDDTGVGVSRIDFHVNLDDETLLRFGLNNKISFIINATPDVTKVEYYYDSALIDPECLWTRPENYQELSDLTILKEAIKQDTYNPDIKHLERGEG